MARTRERYELLIEVLMDLHTNQPNAGWDARALEASERARARSLVEVLAEARINLREGIDEALIAQERPWRSSSSSIGAGSRAASVQFRLIASAPDAADLGRTPR